MAKAEEKDDEVAAEAAAPAKPPGDFVKTYVIVMAVLAAVVGYFAFSTRAQRLAYAGANTRAEGIFGGATLPPGHEAKPIAIRDLAVGIQKYLTTYAEAKGATGGGGDIPIALIKNRAEGMGMSIRSFMPQTTTPNRQKGYEEIALPFVFEATDLERLATFLYNLESSSTKLRILEVRWDLKPDKENPYQPGTQAGNLVGGSGPVVKVGWRRPVTSTKGP